MVLTNCHFKTSEPVKKILFIDPLSLVKFSEVFEDFEFIHLKYPDFAFHSTQSSNFLIFQFPTLCRPDFSPIFVTMLSKKTKYAFHALTYLGKHRDQKTVLIQDISEEYGISHKFLENILLELKKAGILGSKKGKGGGYYLIKEPKDVPLSKVIRLLDGPIALLPCVSLNYYEPCVECKSEVKCGLNKVMIQVRDEMLNVLENKSLADILDKE